MNEIASASLASRMNVSERRVRQLASEGRLPARKVGGSWLIDSSAPQAPHKSRPMAPHIAWAALDMLAPPGEHERWRPHSYRPRPSLIDGIAISDASRLIKRIEHWMHDLNGANASRLRDWVRSRARRVPLAAGSADISAVRADNRLVLSGASDPRSGVSSAGYVCGYLKPEDLADFRDDYLLAAEPHNPNVVAYVSDHDFGPEPQVPLGVVIADLLDGDARERGEAFRLLKEVGRAWK